jgi:hypothetical protein
MIRIEESDWISLLFAKVTAHSDVVRDPSQPISSLTKEQLNKIRNTQANAGEIVRILGHYQDFSLIMKYDGTLGWMHKSWIEHDPTLSDFVRPIGGTKTPLEFLEEFSGVPYLWGGLSKAGIDCSGLTQLYYLSVHNKVIPKNSRDQRKLAPERPFAQVENHDLVFGIGRRGGSHHVALYLNGDIWHAYRDEGVVCHSPKRFCELFRVDAVNRILG